MNMCKIKFKEQGAWFEVKCLLETIKNKKAKGKDTTFERGLLKAWKKYPEYAKYIK